MFTIPKWGWVMALFSHIIPIINNYEQLLTILNYYQPLLTIIYDS